MKSRNTTPIPAVLALSMVLTTACRGEPAVDPQRATRDAAERPRDAVAAGWAQRLDEPEEGADSGRFVLDADGVEANPGPNACLWHPDLHAEGDYRLELDVTHLDSGMHPHGAGLAFGGVDVLGERQRYTYFLVRCDGHFLIKTRDGAATDVVAEWTEHDAVAEEDAEGVLRNRLGVEVRGGTVRFFVNDIEVHARPRGELPVDGRVGLRLVHDIHVRFGPVAVEPD